MPGTTHPENDAPYAPSPISHTGSFQMDRILKVGQVLKRTKRTKSWKSARLVLRPNLLSIYKDQDEMQLRHQITLSEITAVALRRDRKGKKPHLGVFGIFTPTRNFHLEADTEYEARSWVQLIKDESHLNLEDGVATRSGIVHVRPASRHHFQPLDDIIDPHEDPKPPFGLPNTRRPSEYDMSSNEAGSYSDFSDVPVFGSSRDLPLRTSRQFHRTIPFSENAQKAADTVTTTSQAGGTNVPFYQLQTPTDDVERVVWHGYLQCRKSQGKWKKYWVVLRYKSLALYKDDEEYAAMLIIPLSTVVDAVETDSMSRTKKYCMQIITEDRSYRFCAADEDELSNWVGRLKSSLAKRKEVGLR